MMGDLLLWWRGRTSRERGLLLTMFALLGMVLGWLLVVRPLADGLDAVQRRHAAAVIALGEAQTRAEAAGRLPAGAASTAPLPIDSYLSRTANEAGFIGARISGRGPARASVAIDAARPQALFGWVRDMEAHGLTVEFLRARTNSDRTVAVELAFRARGR
jgi:general secretion pathway protein M